MKTTMMKDQTAKLPINQMMEVSIDGARLLSRNRLLNLCPKKSDSGTIICGQYEFEDIYRAVSQAWGFIYESNDALFHSAMSDWAFAIIFYYLERKYEHTLLDLFVDRSQNAMTEEGQNGLFVEYACLENDRGNQVQAGFFEIQDFFDSRPELPRTSRCLTLDAERLCKATPDNSMFMTSYPLSNHQANIIRTILSNVEGVDIRSMFQCLLPIYLEAKASSKARRKIITADTKESREQAEDLALIDLEEVLDLNTEPSLIANLPTLKECLSEGFNGGSY